MNLLELTQKLISIPSYVDGKNNEKQLADFLFEYLKKNLPWFKLEKQIVEGTRYNLIATTGDNPKLIFLSHLDTVLPNNDTQTQTKMINGKLYGLGSCDMKGGLAATIKTCEEIGPTGNLALIFDCDEEYYFKGVKRLVQTQNLKPELVICPEPTNLEIVNGCRGVIEIEFDVLGKSTHAGRPNWGINAIEQAVSLVCNLQPELQKTDLPKLGSTTVNLSALQGGKWQSNKVVIQANAVPDIAKVLLDIRPANPNLEAKKVLQVLISLAKNQKLGIVNEKINIDMKPYLTERNNLKKLEQAISEVGLTQQYRQNLGNGGFYESAIVSNYWKCPAINFGPKNAKTAHSNNEYVEIPSLEKTKEIFKNLIK